MWPENVKRRSVTMLESGGHPHPDLALTSAFVK